MAQVIRRFRDLDMPLGQVKAVLQAPDLETTTKEIISHLTAMEARLTEMQMSVASLRALLEGPPVRPEAEFRSIPATPALAVRATVDLKEAWAWGAGAFGELYDLLDPAWTVRSGSITWSRSPSPTRTATVPRSAGRCSRRLDSPFTGGRRFGT